MTEPEGHATKDSQSGIDVERTCVGAERTEPGRRAERDAHAASPAPGSSAVGFAPGVRDRLSDELIDELLAGARPEEEIVGPGGLLADLIRRLVEQAMSAEMTQHLGYEPHAHKSGREDLPVQKAWSPAPNRCLIASQAL